jgi:hypothetical protein
VRAFASLARMDAFAAWGGAGNNVLKTVGDNRRPE